MVQTPCVGERTAVVDAPAGPSPPDDAALVAAARADPRQFGLLYERYVGPVYRYCYLQFGARAAAEDATSEVFLKALAGLSGFRDGSVPAWLFTIARHTVIDLRRKQRPHRSIDEGAEIADRGAMPERLAVDAARRDALRAALAALPADQRAAVELGLAGWSGEQIAGSLKRSRGAVYLLRTRALARLAKSLRRAGWSPEGA